jgi:hypothetical protein
LSGGPTELESVTPTRVKEEESLRSSAGTPEPLIPREWTELKSTQDALIETNGPNSEHNCKGGPEFLR